ncbi:hypothetical protein TCAL_02748, partial [Tigriopus californicus]
KSSLPPPAAKNSRPSLSPRSITSFVVWVWPLAMVTQLTLVSSGKAQLLKVSSFSRAHSFTLIPGQAPWTS